MARTIGKSKRPPARTSRKPSYVKSRAVSRYVPRGLGGYTGGDQMPLMCEGYFELLISPTDVVTNVACSIRLDPRNMSIDVTGCPGVDIGSGSFTPTGEDKALPNQRIEFLKYKRMADLYKQFKMNSVSVRITSDLNCLNNAIQTTYDRDDKLPITDVGVMKAQSHKDHIPNATNRVAVFGHRFTGDQNQWHTMSDGIIEQDCGYIKILQRIDPYDRSEDTAGTAVNGVTPNIFTPPKIRLKVDVIANLVLKDSHFAASGTGLAQKHTASLGLFQ